MISPSRHRACNLFLISEYIIPYNTALICNQEPIALKRFLSEILPIRRLVQVAQQVPHGYSLHKLQVHLQRLDSGTTRKIDMYDHILSVYPTFAALLLSAFMPSASAALLEVLPRAEQTTVVATVTVQSPSVTSIPDTTSYTNPENLQTDILNSTNFYRFEHNATALAWNASLASYAQSWASHCRWKHSGGPYGENLAAGYPSATESVDGWGDERAEYNFNTPTGFSEATGHFTQLVWKGTTSTGCAAVNCTGKGGMDGFFLVCEYYPPGNVVGDNNAFFVQNVQSQIHNGGPTGTSTGSRTATSTVTTSATASATGQNGLGNEGTPSRATRGLWTLAAFVAALALAGGMI